MLDHTDREILQCLQRDARMQWQEIGKIVHLTGQAVAVRIRSMQDEGIIEAFTVSLNHEKLGKPIYALISVFMSSANHLRFQRFLLDRGDIIEAFRITGEGCYWLKANLANQEELNKLLDEVLIYGNACTKVGVDNITMIDKVPAIILYFTLSRPLWLLFIYGLGVRGVIGWYQKLVDLD